MVQAFVDAVEQGQHLVMEQALDLAHIRFQSCDACFHAGIMRPAVAAVKISRFQCLTGLR